MRVVKKCGRVYGGECGKVRWCVGIGEGRGTGVWQGKVGECIEESGRVYRVSEEKCVG